MLTDICGALYLLVSDDSEVLVAGLIAPKRQPGFAGSAVGALLHVTAAEVTIRHNVAYSRHQLVYADPQRREVTRLNFISQ
jgi:hypothetical protein